MPLFCAVKYMTRKVVKKVLTRKLVNDILSMTRKVVKSMLIIFT